MKPLHGSSGQSTIEVIAAAPVVLLCGLLALQALAAGATHVYADNAVHAGALASQLGRSPSAAARAAIPGWARGRAMVGVRSGRIHVRLQPRAIVPGLGRLLEARASASFVATAR
ncbi:MAG TPA: hypothetical protein VGO97_05650 [Solirubrobacterales bacterium]|jgi:hypothetical protein|nr:hypothetical protein [Solirubrobacterales bacterium]